LQNLTSKSLLLLYTKIIKIVFNPSIRKIAWEVDTLTTHYFSDLDKSKFIRPVITVGIFDGVHKGHRYIIDQMQRQAVLNAGQTVIITLWPHPRMVLYPGKEIKLLSTLDEKIELLESSGVDHLVLVPFDKGFAALKANEFIEKVLVEKIGVQSLLLGFDNHFGNNKEGNYEVVRQASLKYGFELLHPAPLFDGRDSVSSTDIRLYLELGEIEKANHLLGYNYFITGKVVEGQKLGRTLSFPTANIVTDEFKMLPRVGVYAVKVKTGYGIFNGMLNIGFRPTVDHNSLHKTIEAHLFDFNNDLYDTIITVTFVARLRDERKFASIDDLRGQLEKDRTDSINILKHIS